MCLCVYVYAVHLSGRLAMCSTIGNPEDSHSSGIQFTSQMVFKCYKNYKCASMNTSIYIYMYFVE